MSLNNKGLNRKGTHAQILLLLSKKILIVTMERLQNNYGSVSMLTKYYKYMTQNVTQINTFTVIIIITIYNYYNYYMHKRFTNKNNNCNW